MAVSAGLFGGILGTISSTLNWLFGVASGLPQLQTNG